MPVFLDPLAQAKGYIFNQAKYMLDIYNGTAFCGVKNMVMNQHIHLPMHGGFAK